MKKTKTKHKMEAPVSYSQALLLRQHGFTWRCTRYYTEQGTGERIPAPSIRRAVIFYDTRLNPAYESIYNNQAVAVSAIRLDYLQALYGGNKVQHQSQSQTQTF